MKTLWKNLLFVVITATSIQQVKAQDYQTGIGIRGGFYNGLTIKSFVNESTAIEGILTTRWQGFNATLLVEKHLPLEIFNFYYGAGGHIGTWNNDRNPYYNRNGNYAVIGVDGILGIEYNFQVIPLNLSLDWKPTFNLAPYSTFWYDEVALSLRVIF